MQVRAPHAREMHGKYRTARRHCTSNHTLRHARNCAVNPEEGFHAPTARRFMAASKADLARVHRIYQTRHTCASPESACVEPTRRSKLRIGGMCDLQTRSQRMLGGGCANAPATSAEEFWNSKFTAVADTRISDWNVTLVKNRSRVASRSSGET